MSGSTIIIITPPPPPPPPAGNEKSLSKPAEVAFVGSIPRFLPMLRLTLRIWANWMRPL